MNAQEGWILDANRDGAVDLSDSEENDNHWTFHCVGKNIYTVRDKKYGGYLTGRHDRSVRHRQHTAGMATQWELIHRPGRGYHLRNVMTRSYLDANGTGRVDLDSEPEHDDEWILYHPNPAYDGTKKFHLGGGGLAYPKPCGCVQPPIVMPTPLPGGSFDNPIVPPPPGTTPPPVAPPPPVTQAPRSRILVLQNAQEGWILDANRDGIVDLSPSEENDNHWKFVCHGHNIYTLRDMKYGGYLRAHRDGRVNHSANGHGRDVQWEVISLHGGGYHLRNVATRMYLDANGKGRVDQDMHPDRDDEWHLYLPNPHYDGTKKKFSIGGGGPGHPPVCGCACECFTDLGPDVTARGTLVAWITNDESGILGYNLLDAAGSAINDTLLVSGQGVYAVETGSRSGTYQLEVINDDLSRTVEDLVVIDASPRQGVATFLSEGQRTRVVADTNLLLPGAIEARLDGAILNGEFLVTEEGSALYIYIPTDGIVISD